MPFSIFQIHCALDRTIGIPFKSDQIRGPMSFVGKAQARHNVEPSKLELLQWQIKRCHEIIFSELEDKEGVHAAEEFSRQYHVDLIRFSMYVMKLDGRIAATEVEVFNLLFGGNRSVRDFERLISGLGSGDVEKFSRSIPPSVETAVRVLSEVCDNPAGKEPLDPAAVPELYLNVAAAIAAADGRLDPLENQGASSFIARLFDYVASTVRADSPFPSGGGMSRETACALLGIESSNPTSDQIKEAYRNAMQLNHPDKYAGNEKLRKHAEEQCRRINEAKARLLQSEDAEDSAPQVQGKWESGASWAREGRSRPSPFQDSSDDAHVAPKAESETPLVDVWETSWGFSALGILLSLVASYVVVFLAIWCGSLISTMLTGSPDDVGILYFSLMVGLLLPSALGILYATLFYPSYFGKSPRLKSVRAVSLLNFMFGWVVFGALWNSNLSKSRQMAKPTKGISYLVYVGLSVLAMIYQTIPY